MTQTQITFDQFLLLNENDFTDFQSGFYYIKNYIEGFTKNGYKRERIIDLSGLIDKFIQFGNPIRETYSTTFGELKTHLNNLTDCIHKNNYSSTTSIGSAQWNINTQIEYQYQMFYSKFLEVYNKIILHLRNNNKCLDLNGLFLYNVSNKKQAIIYIQEAIDLILNDSNITKKAKDKIIQYLHIVIEELNNPTTNWEKYFSKVSEVIIVLGALGSIAGAAISGSQLFNAQEKINKATETIVKTSINLNYSNLKETFIINGDYRIGDNNIFLLPDK